MKSVAELLAGAVQRGRVPTGVTSPEDFAAREATYNAAKAKAEQEAARRRDESFALHLARCGAPERVQRDAAAPGLSETDALRAARRWVDSDAGHLVLSGWTGTGKSVAAAWALRGALRVAGWAHFGELEWDSEAAMWLPFGELARLSDYEERDRATFARARRVRWLVLDDVGLGSAAECPPHVASRLELLADDRDAPGRRTVWTTNKTLRRPREDEPHELARYVGQRIYSRISRSVLPVDCGTTDLRRQK
jgi:hypothetical protein